MNGNTFSSIARSASGSTCFQFVKRMNGNKINILIPINFYSLVILLPIREAYEWKLLFAVTNRPWSFVDFLLPIREAYEWKRARETPMEPVILVEKLASNSWSVWMETKTSPLEFCLKPPLLPIREAYEWKPRTERTLTKSSLPCFQFVKRMNGNIV